VIRTIDEILERAEERKKWQEFDAFCLNILPVPPEPLTPEEAEEQQREWEEMLAAAKAKATSKDEVFLPVSGHECWGISPKLENLNLTDAAGGIGAVGK